MGVTAELSAEGGEIRARGSHRGPAAGGGARTEMRPVWPEQDRAGEGGEGRREHRGPGGGTVEGHQLSAAAGERMALGSSVPDTQSPFTV